MIKIIINGEAHNSYLSPLIAIRDIKALRDQGVNVICASEDYKMVGEEANSNIESGEEFLFEADKINRAGKKLKGSRQYLFDELENDQVSSASGYSREEISTFKELRSEFEIPRKYGLDLVEIIFNFEAMVNKMGGDGANQKLYFFYEAFSIF
jgi:hypothetical protein